MKTSCQKLLLVIFSMFTVNSYSVEVTFDKEESKPTTSNDIFEDYFDNDVSELINQEEIRVLKGSYISPYNYLQDPIALDMGYDRESSSSGAYHGGTSIIGSMNSPNTLFNTDIAQIWGQTGRFGGFALGGSLTGTFNITQSGNPSINRTTGILAPTQSYVNYQYSNKVDVSAGNVLITSPWVNSVSSNPGATYAVVIIPIRGPIFKASAPPAEIIRLSQCMV